LHELAAGPGDAPDHRRRWLTWRRAVLAAVVIPVLVAAALFPVRHRFTAQGADLSRQLIGDERTARLEAWYFRAEDKSNSWKYRLLGGEANPFDEKGARVEFIAAGPQRTVNLWLGPPAVEPPASFEPTISRTKPMALPTTKPLRSNPEAGEGEWTTVGLPRSTPSDPLMAKTFLRPDPSRPYAQVGVLLVDSRRVRLHLTGGTADPGGDRGVKGPGAVAPQDLSTLLAAWTGGFKGPHGNYGMYADGKEYRPLRTGLASIVAYKDGSFAVGQWGRDLSWSDQVEAVRQNAVLLVDDGAVSSRVREGNDTWGYVEVNSAEFITWRSAVGVTADGHLLVAAGNSLSAETLARALQAAGARYAMQLDINSPYVLTALYFSQPDAAPRAEKFMSSMPDNPARFLRPGERDFMYITLDEADFYKADTVVPGIH
jgi:hypothetical protein